MYDSLRKLSSLVKLTCDCKRRTCTCTLCWQSSCDISWCAATLGTFGWPWLPYKHPAPTLILLKLFVHTKKESDKHLCCARQVGWFAERSMMQPDWVSQPPCDCTIKSNTAHHTTLTQSIHREKKSNEITRILTLFHFELIMLNMQYKCYDKASKI